MNTKAKVQGACRGLISSSIGAALLLSAATGLQAGTILWSNGSLSGNAANVCDSGPGTCGNTSTTSWTMFDNFSVPNGTTWTVTGFDYTDQFVNTPNADYKNTSWSLWAGDPLKGGTLVMTGTNLGTLSLISGSCATGSLAPGSCVNEVTVNLGSQVYLAGGKTYFLGTSNILSSTNDNTYREYSNGGNAAPGGTLSASLWEQSNGVISGSNWSGSVSNNANIANEVGSATAFDIIGVNGTPEPGTLMLLGIGFAGLVFVQRRKTA